MRKTPILAGGFLALASVVVPAASADGEPVVAPDRLADAATEGEAFATMGDFAWRAFVALNWPASTGGAGGEPDRDRALGDRGARVWETFKSEAETFPVGADGRRVQAEAGRRISEMSPCGGPKDKDAKTIASPEPFAEFNQPSFAADAPGNTLIARNGEYVRYEVRFNPAEFAALRKWSGGKNMPDARRPARVPSGAVAVKAAWRPLNALDTPAARARYYVTRAAIADVEKTRAAGRLVCVECDVALVGLHIVIRTDSRPQGIWASFEHVDNVPPVGKGAAREPDARDARAPYGFFDAARPAKLWPPFGADDTLPVGADNPPQRAPGAMQVVRRHPIAGALMAANRAYWQAAGVKGTLWEHYMLVAAQWPTSAEPPGPDNDGAYAPGPPDRAGEPSYNAIAPAEANLANTTMETYLQDAPSSCMACHHAAANRDGFDFVGALAKLR